jgi:hypothetical protein
MSKVGKLSCHLGQWIGMRNLARFAKFLAYPRTPGYLPHGTRTPVFKPSLAELSS